MPAASTPFRGFLGETRPRGLPPAQGFHRRGISHLHDPSRVHPGLHRMQAMQDGGGAHPGSTEVRYEDFETAAKALQALEQYKLLMQQPEPDLVQGACLVACHRYPWLDSADVVDQLDDLAEQVLPRLPQQRYPLAIARSISAYLHGNRGFRGNAGDYYDVDNSCLNKVLERRLGIPLTLSIVYMEVARRCGFELHGCSLPGHFLLTPADPELEFFIDPFEGGRVAFLDDVETTLQKIYGGPVKVDSQIARRSEPLPSRTFLARMLNNLKAVYAARKNYQGAYSMTCYARATRPGDVQEILDAGFILWHMKRYGECASVLREYIARAPEDAKDASKVRRLLRVLRDVDMNGDEDAPGF